MEAQNLDFLYKKDLEELIRSDKMNVYLFFEHCLEAENYEYGSEQRISFIDKGKEYVDKLIKKVYDIAYLKGQNDVYKNVYKELKPLYKKIEDQSALLDFSMIWENESEPEEKDLT